MSANELAAFYVTNLFTFSVNWIWGFLLFSVVQLQWKVFREITDTYGYLYGWETSFVQTHRQPLVSKQCANGAKWPAPFRNQCNAETPDIQNCIFGPNHYFHNVMHVQKTTAKSKASERDTRTCLTENCLPWRVALHGIEKLCCRDPGHYMDT